MIRNQSASESTLTIDDGLQWIVIGVATVSGKRPRMKTRKSEELSMSFSFMQAVAFPYVVPLASSRRTEQADLGMN